MCYPKFNVIKKDFSSAITYVHTVSMPNSVSVHLPIDPLSNFHPSHRYRPCRICWYISPGQESVQSTSHPSSLIIILRPITKDDRQLHGIIWKGKAEGDWLGELTRVTLRHLVLTVIPPLGLLRILIARLYVEGIVWRTLLISTATQHRRNAKADGRDW